MRGKVFLALPKPLQMKPDRNEKVINTIIAVAFVVTAILVAFKIIHFK